MQSEGRFQFCVNDDDIVLGGTRDSAYFYQDHSYVVYEVHKCTDEIKNSLGLTVDCAPDDEIDNFLKGKKLSYRVI